MEQRFDLFNQPEMPSVIICNPNFKELHAIDRLIYDTNVKWRYNALSEFTFKMPKSINGGNTTLLAYEYIKTKRYINVEGLGYFIVQKVEEENDGSVSFLDVYCESLEAELMNKKITDLNITSIPIITSLVGVEYEKEIKIIYGGDPKGEYDPLTTYYVDDLVEYNNVYYNCLIDGTVGIPPTNTSYWVNSTSISYYYKTVLYPNGNPVILNEDGMQATLGITERLIEEYIPNWTRDTSKPIPSSLISYEGETGTSVVAVIARSFKISDSSVYSFMVNELEKSYGCAVIFNRKERKFHFETMENIEQTNVNFSYNNLIKKTNVIEYSDELATSLSCYGGEGININYANPLGTNKLYNFDYYRNTEWMSEELCNLIGSTDVSNPYYGGWKLAVQKEVIGNTNPNHPGEAWGFTSGGEAWSPQPYVRYLQELKKRSIAYGYPLYAYDLRLEEIGIQRKLANNFSPTSNEYKYYRTNIQDLTGEPYQMYVSFPTSTLDYVSAYMSPEYIEVGHVLGSSSETVLAASEEFLQPRGNLQLSVTVYTGNPPQDFTGSVVIYGTNYLDASISETVVLNATDVTYYTAYTTNYYKTITRIDYPSATNQGDMIEIKPSDEYLGSVISIPSDYQLKNIYGTTFPFTLPWIFWNFGTTNGVIGWISACMSALKTLESGEKYSNFVSELMIAYQEKSFLETLKTGIENLIEEETVLMASAIQMGAGYNSKRLDHKKNIEWLTQSAQNYDFNSSGIPSTENVNPNFTLSSDENKMSYQRLVDLYILLGTTSDGKELSAYDLVEGLHGVISQIKGYEYYIERLIEIMSFITDSLNPIQYFGAYYADELSPFIIENTYQNEYSVNYSNKIEEKIETAIDLYNQSLEVLERVSTPRYEFSIDLVNFLNLPEYKETFSKEIDLGKKVILNLESSVLEVILLEIEFSFSDMDKLSMTFGNRLRLDDVRFQYTDFIGQIYKTGSDVSFDKRTWRDFESNYKNDVSQLITTPPEKIDNIYKYDLLSDNRGELPFEVKVAGGGIFVRRKLGEMVYYKDQMFITGGVISYTTDDWSTINYK